MEDLSRLYAISVMLKIKEHHSLRGSRGQQATRGSGSQAWSCAACERTQWVSWSHEEPWRVRDRNRWARHTE